MLTLITLTQVKARWWTVIDEHVGFGQSLGPIHFNSGRCRLVGETLAEHTLGGAPSKKANYVIWIT